MYLSGRFLLAIRMPFGVELNSTSFFYSLPDDDQHGRKKKIKGDVSLFLMSVHLADALLLAGATRPSFENKKEKIYIPFGI